MPGMCTPTRLQTAARGGKSALLLVALVLAAAGCRPPPETPTDKPPEPQVTELRDAIEQPLEDAHEVQRTLDDAAARQREVVEAAGG